jgi:TolB-like protein/Tfp pilus assembly protein PilF
MLTKDGSEGRWALLRRRKVVQWGVLYVAGAWGVLEGVGFVADAFGWPATTKQLATLALLIGLPIVLVLAWFHGDRGQQRVSAPELAILTLIFLAGGGIFWLHQRQQSVSATELAILTLIFLAGGGIFWLHQRGVGASTAATRLGKVEPPVSETDSRPSIAVMPFENRSRLVDDAFFADGIHDDILTQLAKVSALRVISRASVERFRNSDQSAPHIARQLGVNNILRGGVQRAGKRVRIYIQLIDANADSHLWAESYDRALSAATIFAIQSEVASAVAGALKTALTPAEQAQANVAPTQNLHAWEAYQLGKQRMATRASADLADAEQFFREAIDLDPNFALAHVGLADTNLLRAQYSGAPEEVTLTNAENAATAALKLDPNLAEAWASSGFIAFSRWQFDLAESMYRRAIELNPNYAPVRHWYSNLLRDTGRLDEAVAQIERAVELDPLSAVIRENLGGALAAQGKFHEAEIAFRRALTIDPSRPQPYWILALLNAYAFNQFADAIPLAQRATELDSGSPIPLVLLANMYADLGDDDKSLETNATAAKRWPDSPLVQFNLAVTNLYRRNAAGAVRHAFRAFGAEPRSGGALNIVQAGGALNIIRNADLTNGHYDDAIVRYEEAYPEFFVEGAPRIDGTNYWAAIDLALVSQSRGDHAKAHVLLDGAARAIRTTPRLSSFGYGIADVQIHALLGQKAAALAVLREAEEAGWRAAWRFYRDIEPSLASIRNEPEFKAIFADIEVDMGRQRAELAAR